MRTDEVVRKESRLRTSAQARRRKRVTKIALTALLAFISLMMIVPFVWMVLTSLRADFEFGGADAILPADPQWSNYPRALRNAPFLTYARNSLTIAVVHTLMTLVLGSTAGYALAKLPFRGRNIALMLFVGSMMIPMYTTVIPQFLIVRFMALFGGNDIFGQGGSGWLNTWWALLIPGGLSAFMVFMFRQFYVGLPNELMEAARIDGLGEFGIYARIMTPQIKPALLTVTLMTFEGSWNNFLWPLLVTTRDDQRVIQVGLSTFRLQNTTQWNLLMAGTTMSALPMIILFLALQRYFVSGFTTAGIK